MRPLLSKSTGKLVLVLVLGLFAVEPGRAQSPQQGWSESVEIPLGLASITGIAFSSDGETLAIASGSSGNMNASPMALRLVRINDGRISRNLWGGAGMEPEVKGFCPAMDAFLIDAGPGARIFVTRSGKSVSIESLGLKPNEDQDGNITLSPDGNLLALSDWDRPGDVQVFEFVNGAPRRRFSLGFDAERVWVSFQPMGKLLAVDDGKNSWILDPDTGVRRTQIRGSIHWLSDGGIVGQINDKETRTYYEKGSFTYYDKASFHPMQSVPMNPDEGAKVLKAEAMPPFGMSFEETFYLDGVKVTGKPHFRYAYSPAKKRVAIHDEATGRVSVRTYRGTTTVQGDKE